MKEFFQVCPPELIARRQQAPTQLVTLKLPGWADADASTINFRHLSDWQGLGSQQYGAVLIDEAGQVDEDAALMLLTRLRHPAQRQRWFVAASNPWPGWFQRWFVRRDLPEDALREAQGQISFIPARIADNPYLPDNYEQVNQALLPQPWRERFIDGRFDALLGRIYPNFDPDIHCWNAPLPEFSHYIGGLDFGGQTETAHHTAAILAGVIRRPPPLGEVPRRGGGGPPQPPNSNLTIIRLAEFEDRGPGVIQRLEQFQKDCKRRFGPIRWCADRSQSAWIDHQRRQGIKVEPSTGGPGSVNYGISLVHDRFADDPPTSFYIPQLTQFPKRGRRVRLGTPAGRPPTPNPESATTTCSTPTATCTNSCKRSPPAANHPCKSSSPKPATEPQPTGPTDDPPKTSPLGGGAAKRRRGLPHPHPPRPMPRARLPLA